MNSEEFKKMPSLNLPPYDMKIEDDGKDLKIYDPIRHKMVVLTPEEFVRQHFVAWIHHQYGYPRSLIANEIGITVNGTKKRCDTVVFNREGDPLMIVEYKAPGVTITQDTFDQIVRYNMSLKARYLVVSNGLNHYCCVIDYNSGTYNFIPGIPTYKEINDTLGLN